jgi:hypothetical protein
MPTIDRIEWVIIDDMGVPTEMWHIFLTDGREQWAAPDTSNWLIDAFFANGGTVTYLRGG